MSLISISADVLVNPSSITRVEQKKAAGKTVTYVTTPGHVDVLQVPLKDFYQSLKIKEQSEGKQHFAG